MIFVDLVQHATHADFFCLPNSDSDVDVTIVVGDRDARFIVRWIALRDRSPVLAEQLRKHDGKLGILDEDPYTFRDYLTVVHGGCEHVPVLQEEDERDWKQRVAGMDVFEGLVDVWIMADGLVSAVQDGPTARLLRESFTDLICSTAGGQAYRQRDPQRDPTPP